MSVYYPEEISVLREPSTSGKDDVSRRELRTIRSHRRIGWQANDGLGGAWKRRWADRTARSPAPDEGAGEKFFGGGHDFIGLVGFDEGAHGFAVLVVLARHDQVDVGRLLIFDEEAVPGRSESDLAGIGRVDDGEVNVVERTRKLGGFEFDDLDLFGAADDVEHRAIDTNAGFQRDEALAGEKGERAPEVGWIIGHGDLRAGGQGVEGVPVESLRIGGNRIHEGVAHSREFVTAIPDLLIQIGAVLEGVDVERAIGKGGVGDDVVAEGHDLHIKAVAVPGHLFGDFGQLFLGAGDHAEPQGTGIVLGAAGGEEGEDGGSEEKRCELAENTHVGC